MAAAVLIDRENTESATTSRKLAFLALAEVGALLGPTVTRKLADGLTDVDVEAAVVVEEELDLIRQGETQESEEH
jgi:hypothetical protein